MRSRRCAEPVQHVPGDTLSIPRIFFTHGTNYIVLHRRVGVRRPAFQLGLVDLTISNTLKNKLILKRQPRSNGAEASGMWVALAAWAGTGCNSFALGALEEAATARTEDPPFGGLWCDQPAIFLGGGWPPREKSPTFGRRKVTGGSVLPAGGAWAGRCRNQQVSARAGQTRRLWPRPHPLSRHTRSRQSPACAGLPADCATF